MSDGGLHGKVHMSDIPEDRLKILERLAPLSLEAALSDKATPEVELWTLSCLEDKLFLHLAGIKKTVISEKGEAVIVRKYYQEALRIWKWLLVAKPVPKFQLSWYDLSPRLQLELTSMDRTGAEKVIRLAVGRIFENIDFDEYHLTIARYLAVEIVP